MYLLVAIIIVFMIGRLVMSPWGAEVDPYLWFIILFVAHYAVGALAWSAHYSGFPNRLSYLLAMTLHTGTYALNWDAYSAHQLDIDPNSLLVNVMVIGGVFLPSMLLYAGAFVALATYPADDEEEE